MVTHIPMAVHPDVKNVLIIGGADGGVARELIKYKCIERIDVVEPDEMLVEVCRKHFPELTCGLDDDRVNVYIQDALRFLRNKTGDYDLIINDATDPFGYTEGLFTKEFYGSCYKALKSDGIMVYQHGSPFYSEDKDECILNIHINPIIIKSTGKLRKMLSTYFNKHFIRFNNIYSFYTFIIDKFSCNSAIGSTDY